jgi:hypothetical protein
MSKPVIMFDVPLQLAFMQEPDDELLDDEDNELANEPEEDPDPAEVLEAMQDAIPKDALSLGSLEYELDHSPGLSWRIEDHFYLVPLKDDPYQWALIRITWDDNYGSYGWAAGAFGSGFRDAKEASRAMVFELFERWRKAEDDEDSPAIEERQSFLRRL